MDAVLRTQSETCSLRMRSVELYADGSGGSCYLEVMSEPFSGRMNFFFDATLGEFIAELTSLDRQLVGSARLGLDHEDHFIELRGDGRGHVRVSGLLCEYNEHGQQLKFSFTTDQTSLGAFIDGLVEVLAARDLTRQSTRTR